MLDSWRDLVVSHPASRSHAYMVGRLEEKAEYAREQVVGRIKRLVRVRSIWTSGAAGSDSTWH